MKKKHYRKPIIKKVKLMVAESVLAACKLATASQDPTTRANQACNVGGTPCQATAGS